DLSLYSELGSASGMGYEEVADALRGQKKSMVRVNSLGEVIVSVAVPVLRSRTIHGALMLSTQGDDIDQMVTAERLAILKVGGVRDREGRRFRPRGHDRSFPFAREHHRRPGAAARRFGRSRPPPHQDAR